MEKYKRYKDKEKRKKYLRSYQRTYMRNYRAKLKKLGIKRLWNEKGYLKKLRKKALEVLGGSKCSNCGCEVEKILEINHKEGGGRKELKKYHFATKHLHQDIIKGRVDISKYNVLCKVCNTQHYVETILGISGHTVIWKMPV